MQILHVVGARPNFMKAAPVISALATYPNVTQLLVHTGQHYDAKMSDIFFVQLGIPKPDINLAVGSGSHAAQTAEILIRFEEVVTNQRPDLVLVYGDVNSTVATALVCTKLLIPVGHVEAGLRSRDRTMPEEINRLITDQISDLLFTPSTDGDENLMAEGIPAAKIHCVGNVMIDTLVRLLPATEALDVPSGLGLEEQEYGLVTLHRPSNVDDPTMLGELMATLSGVSHKLPLIFPVHPRTRTQMEAPTEKMGEHDIRFVEPLGYLEFLALQRHARLILTDSGGIQEESTYLGVPCLTIRENTERPITVTIGTNTLVGQDMEQLRQGVDLILSGDYKRGEIPPLWDGKAAQRIASVIVEQGAV